MLIMTASSEPPQEPRICEPSEQSALSPSRGLPKPRKRARVKLMAEPANAAPPTRCLWKLLPAGVKGSLQPATALDVFVIVLGIEAEASGHEGLVEQAHALTHPVRAEAGESEQPLLGLNSRARPLQPHLSATESHRLLVKDLHIDRAICKSVQHLGELKPRDGRHERVRAHLRLLGQPHPLTSYALIGGEGAALRALFRLRALHGLRLDAGRLRAAGSSL